MTNAQITLAAGLALAAALCFSCAATAPSIDDAVHAADSASTEPEALDIAQADTSMAAETIDSASTEPEIQDIAQADTSITLEVRGKIITLIIDNMDKISLEPGIKSGFEQLLFFTHRNRNIIGFSTLAVSAASTGMALWQYCEVSSKKRKAQRLLGETATAQSQEAYSRVQRDYAQTVSELRRHEALRDGFYISAALFGAAYGMHLFLFF